VIIPLQLNRFNAEQTEENTANSVQADSDPKRINIVLVPMRQHCTENQIKQKRHNNNHKNYFSTHFFYPSIV
jgi:hypothetical protein